MKNTMKEHNDAAARVILGRARGVKPDDSGNGEKRSAEVTIPPPKFTIAELKIVGTSPFVQHKFAQKAIITMRDGMTDSTKKSKKKRAPRDFDADYLGSQHRSKEGWIGIPAATFRAAMISACRLVGFKMTLAKLGVFVEADGLDVEEGTPLIKIMGTPEKHESVVRLPTGVPDIRVRTMFREWSARVRIRFDSELFSLTDITNLMNRVGQQVGIGEGRNDSPNSCGMGWGSFMVVKDDE